MTGKIDFWVPWNEDKKKLAISQLDYAWLERNRCGKNTLVCHTGDSSEGKSTATMKAIDEILSAKGIDFIPYQSTCTVYTPMEYPAKIDKLLYDPEFAEIPFLILDDARFVVNAKHWFDFINQAIVDITSISRRQKPITLIINTPYLTDIDKDLRRSLTFWGECYRPLHSAVETHYVRFYHETRDPENIKIKKRSFRGVVVRDNKNIMTIPPRYVFTKPRPALWNKYDEESHEAKNKLLRGRIDALLAKMKKELGINDRLEQMIAYYSEPKNYAELSYHLDNKRGKVSVRKDSLAVLNLSKDEASVFLVRVQENLKIANKGVVVEGLHGSEAGQ